MKRPMFAFALLLISLITVQSVFMPAPLRAQTYSSRADVTAAIHGGFTRSDVTPLLGASNGSPLTTMVWAHVLPAGSRLDQPSGSFSNTPAALFGAHYPLNLQPPGTGTNNGVEIQKYADLKAAGVDGISVDRFTDPSFFAGHISCADTAGLKFAPCVDTSLLSSGQQAAVISYIGGYLDAAGAVGTHPSVMMVGSAYVIFTYQQFQGMNAANWQAVRTAMLARSTPATLYIVGDVAGNYTTATQFSTTVAAKMATCDMGYWFGDCHTNYDYSRLIGYIATQSKPFALPVAPGYDRETQVAFDPMGDLRCENDWMQNLQTQAQYPSLVPWMHLSTADDCSEQTDLQADSDKSNTFLTLTAWYVALFKRQSLPMPDVRVSIHVPQSVYMGVSTQAVVRCFNPSAKTVLLHVTGYGSDNNGIYNNNLPVPPATTMTVTIPVKLTSSDSSHFYLTVDGSAKTLTNDSNGYGHFDIGANVTDDLTGSAIAGTTLYSPNTALYANTYPGSILEQIYYSLSSNQTIGSPTAYVHKSAGSTPTYYVYMTAAPGTTAKFLELLWDTRQVLLAYNLNTVSNVAFTAPANALDDRQDSTDHQYFMAREVDVNNNVSYYGPIQVMTP